jgi:hypothetical protein
LTLVNFWYQARHGAAVVRDVTLLQRVLGAGAVIWFYLYKALLPFNLMFVYPQWHVRSDDVRWWLPLSGAAAATVVLLWQRHRPAVRVVLCGWAFFLLALVPVMGLTDVYFMSTLVADHYQTGPARRRHGGRGRSDSAGAPLASAADDRGGRHVMLLASATWRQSHQWRVRRRCTCEPSRPIPAHGSCATTSRSFT